jgi:hypothetical protein
MSVSFHACRLYHLVKDNYRHQQTWHAWNEKDKREKLEEIQPVKKWWWLSGKGGLCVYYVIINLSFFLIDIERNLRSLHFLAKSCFLVCNIWFPSKKSKKQSIDTKNNTLDETSLHELWLLMEQRDSKWERNWFKERNCHDDISEVSLSFHPKSLPLSLFSLKNEVRLSSSNQMLIKSSIRDVNFNEQSHSIENKKNDRKMTWIQRKLPKIRKSLNVKCECKEKCKLLYEKNWKNPSNPQEDRSK